MKNTLFRKAALEKMSSPEQLDYTIKIIKPKGWLAIITAVLIIAFTLTWSIVGRIPDQVLGSGILLKSGGIFNVEATGNGPIKDIFVERSDLVSRGQIIGRIEQKELLSQIYQIRHNIAIMTENYNQMMGYLSESGNMNLEATEKKKDAIIKEIENLKEEKAYQEQNLKEYEQLFKEGVVSSNEYMQYRNEFNSLEAKLHSLQSQLKTTDLSQFRLIEDSEKELDTLVQKISIEKQTLKQKEDEYEEKTEIVSEVTGLIVEVDAERGDYVQTGSTVVKIEPVGEDIKNIQAVIFFDASQGKKIKMGMPVSISPSTVKQEEFGFIRGLITDIAVFPSTRESMMSILQNETLVQNLMQNKAPIEVKADLIPDPRTPSGFKWSSSQGPDIDIESGYLCSGTVIVSEQRPISLLLPIIKKKIFGIGE